MIEDTVQFIFIRLWEKRDHISTHEIKAYLYVAARLRIINAIRDNQRREELIQNYYLNELIEADAEDIIDMEEFSAFIQEVVERLPEKTRRAYRLNREEKLSYKEIAARENVSVKTVENQIGQALRTIREQARKHYAHHPGLLALFFYYFM